MNFVRMSLILLCIVANLSSLTASPVQEARTQKLSDEWRSTYKFDRELYNEMQAQLKTIIEIQDVLDMSRIAEPLKADLLKKQDVARTQLSSMRSGVVQLMLREFANNRAAQLKDWSGQSLEVRKDIRQGLASREKAIYSALVKIGLPAIPELIDFYARCLKNDATDMAARTKKLLNYVVNEAELELQQSRLQAQMNESQMSEADETMPGFQANQAEAAPVEPEQAELPETTLDFLPLEEN